MIDRSLYVPPGIVPPWWPNPDAPRIMACIEPRALPVAPGAPSGQPSPPELEQDDPARHAPRLLSSRVGA